MITADKDFGELAYRQQFIHHGVVLIRLAGSVGNHLSELPKAFSVITPPAPSVFVRRSPKRATYENRNTSGHSHVAGQIMGSVAVYFKGLDL